MDISRVSNSDNLFLFRVDNRCTTTTTAAAAAAPKTKTPGKNHQLELMWKTHKKYLVIINKEKWTDRNVDFAVPADLRGKIKENENRDKYIDLVRKL